MNMFQINKGKICLSMKKMDIKLIRFAYGDHKQMKIISDCLNVFYNMSLSIFTMIKYFIDENQH